MYLIAYWGGGEECVQPDAVYLRYVVGGPKKYSEYLVVTFSRL